MTAVFQDAINPGWITDPDTSSVSIYTTNTYTNNCTVDQVTSGVVFGDSLLPGSLTNIAITKYQNSPANMVGENSNYSFSFMATTNIPSNGLITITFPEYAAYPSGTPGVDSYTDTYTTYTDGSVKTFTITNACTFGCTAGTVFSLTVTGIKNAGNTRTINPLNFVFQTKTSLGYLIDSSSGVTPTSNDLTIVPNTFTSVT